MAAKQPSPHAQPVIQVERCDDALSPAEDTPLLPSGVYRHGPPRAQPRCVSTRSTVVLVIVIALLVSLGNNIPTMPTSEMIFRRFCPSQVHRAAGSKSNLGTLGCDDAFASREMEHVMRVQLMLARIAGIVFSIPYGILADKIGRRMVLALSIAGIVLAMAWQTLVLHLPHAFSPRAIWASNLWNIIGGGEFVMMATAFAVIADVESDEGRSLSFFALVSTDLFATFISGPMGTKAREFSPWFPFYLSLTLTIMGGLLTAVLPETMNWQSSPQRVSLPAKEERFHARLRRYAQRPLSELRSATNVLQIPAVVFILLTYLISGFIARAPSIVFQYTSKHTRWTMNTYTALIFATFLMRIVLLLVLLPLLSKLLISPAFSLRVHPLCKDILLARLSSVLLVIGAVLMMVPVSQVTIAGLCVFTLGSGFPVLCRSILTALVVEHHYARLYAFISVAEAASLLLTNPLMAWLYALGRQMYRKWLGLPYLALAVFSMFTAVALFGTSIDHCPLEDEEMAEP